MGDSWVTYNQMVVDELADEAVDDLFHALSDPTRRDILRRCAAGESSVSRLAHNDERNRLSVTSVDKDYDNLTITLIADFGAPIEQVWELWSVPRMLERLWVRGLIRRPSRSMTSLRAARSRSS